MTDDDIAPSDRVLFNLGILDLERALVEELGKLGHIDSNSFAKQSGLLKRKVDELAMEANLPNYPGVHTSVEYGTLSVIAMLCEILIARDALDAESLIEAVRRKAEFWRSGGSVYRAIPAEILGDALVVMDAEKKDVDLRIAASRNAIRSGRTQ